MSIPVVYSPERLAAIRAALDAFPDRRGALREILLAIHVAGIGRRGTAPAYVLREIGDLVDHTQGRMTMVPPEHQSPCGPGPFPLHDPFLELISRLIDTPIDAPNRAAAAAARLLAIADVAIALYRFKGKEWE